MRCKFANWPAEERNYRGDRRRIPLRPCTSKTSASICIFKLYGPSPKTALNRSIVSSSRKLFSRVTKQAAASTNFPTSLIVANCLENRSLLSLRIASNFQKNLVLMVFHLKQPSVHSSHHIPFSFSRTLFWSPYRSLCWTFLPTIRPRNCTRGRQIKAISILFTRLLDTILISNEVRIDPRG